MERDPITSTPFDVSGAGPDVAETRPADPRLGADLGQTTRALIEPPYETYASGAAGDTAALWDAVAELRAELERQRRSAAGEEVKALRSAIDDLRALLARSEARLPATIEQHVRPAVDRWRAELAQVESRIPREDTIQKEMTARLTRLLSDRATHADVAAVRAQLEALHREIGGSVSAISTELVRQLASVARVGEIGRLEATLERVRQRVQSLSADVEARFARLGTLALVAIAAELRRRTVTVAEDAADVALAWAGEIRERVVRDLPELLPSMVLAALGTISKSLS